MTVHWAVNIRAPLEPGVYITEWQMVHNKEPFGPKASWNVFVVPKVEGGVTPGAIIKQWWEQQKQRLAEEFYKLVENLKRAGEEWLQRELERLWREFWESLFRQCCGANVIAPVVLLLGAWGINHRRRGRMRDSDRD